MVAHSSIDHTGITGVGAASPAGILYAAFTPTGIDDEFSNASFTGWTEVADAVSITPVEVDSVLSIPHPGGGTAAHVHSWLKAITFAANDWIEVTFLSAMYNVNYSLFNLMFTDGTTFAAGNQAMFSYSPTEQAYFAEKRTGFNARVSSTSYGTANQHNLLRMRLKCVASNSYTVYVSAYGTNWVVMASGLALGTFTPTHVGFGVTTWGSAAPFNWALHYFRRGNG